MRRPMASYWKGAITYHMQILSPNSREALKKLTVSLLLDAKTIVLYDMILDTDFKTTLGITHHILHWVLGWKVER